MFYKDGFVLSDSNITRIAFRLTNSTTELTCGHMTFNYGKNFSPILVAKCGRIRVNASYEELYFESDFKLTENEKQQLQKFNTTTTEGKFILTNCDLSFLTN